MGKDEGSSKHAGDQKEHKKHKHKGDKERKHKERDGDYDYEHKKRRKREEEEGDVGHRKHKHRKKEKKDKKKEPSRDSEGENRMDIVDDDLEAEVWRDKDLTMDGERVLATDIPTSESLNLTSRAEAMDTDPPLPSSTTSSSTLKRDDWMMLPNSAPVLPAETSPRRTKIPTDTDESFTEDYGEPSDGARNSSGGVDFFSNLGTERKRAPRPDRVDPDKLKIHAKELNQDLKEGRQIDFDETPPPVPANTPGGPGSQWRMMRLRRVYETAEEESRQIEEVGVERFGTLQAFQEAVEERRILDEREGRRNTQPRDNDRGRAQERPSQYGKDGEKKLMFTDVGGSGASSRSSSFRRPGGMQDSAPATPSAEGSGPTRPLANKRLDSLRLPSQAGSPLAQSHTPIPTVMTPSAAGPSGSKSRTLSPSSLNKLQAKVIRAKLMGAPDAEKLEQEYEAEAKRSQGIDDRGVRTKVEVLPTLDARGKMYDVGHGGKDDERTEAGNRKKKEQHFETHDRKTGEVLRINADDDTMTLGEMLRQERMGAGMADQKDLDAQYAKAIMGDGKFQNDLDYIDDNAQKLGRQKMRSDAMKRQFAINDFKKTQKAMSSCSFCYGEDDSLPKAPVVAMGTRVYLACTTTSELVPGHCVIVPIQHHLNMLEGDDDVWDETKNFMKCLMRMYAEEDKGVIFYETVLSLRQQKHTSIECVPVPWEQFDLLPGYFKESILTSEAEWSQHKKLIDFSSRPGGFRRAMVPNLPYFMVMFDYKGEKGYGHVIEGAAEAQDEDEYGLAEGEKGGGEFPFYFAGEIIGNVLDLEARKWRRPKKVDFARNGERVAEFKKKYAKHDWTGML
ncbi:CwfJ C-terminus 1-domain-containing protein-like protein [Crepidotus variabilis]|uniref:CwfJ C-terminus 1-domain-containing protein-like protein n=1 Tax=Crepidotus variabilis TaxID=179855 RepID=A0A9P6ETS8_9AGAR|nr:CwfJ C-terminus 1-domain-containing protein-like protein [Crepidotus variabilis]